MESRPRKRVRFDWPLILSSTKIDFKLLHSAQSPKRHLELNRTYDLVSSGFLTRNEVTSYLTRKLKIGKIQGVEFKSYLFGTDF